MTQDTHTQRRIKYGLNVTIAAVAALALVVLINVVGYFRLVQFRADLTATRQYSLSPQTREVLKQLDGDFRIISLLSRNDVNIEQVRDLVAEYQRHSTHITAENIDPVTQNARLERFYDDLQQRYASSLSPRKAAVEGGRQALGKLREDIGQQTDILREMVEKKLIEDEQLNQFVQSVFQALARFDSQYDEIDQQITKTLASPMPDYAAVLDTIRALLTQYDSKIYAIALERFKKVVADENVSGDARNALLALRDRFEATQKHLADAAAALPAGAGEAEGYDQLRNQISSEESVVVLGPNQVRVIKFSEMFRMPDENQMRALEPGQRPELRFLGEEKLTGALVAMSLKEPPLVVFVQGGRQPVLGYQGQYEQVAARLRNLNFEVKDWSPAGKQNPMTGQPMPGGPPPEPKPGQKAIWIITPIEPMNPMMMMGGQQPAGAAQIIEAIGPRLDDGDGVMVIPGLNPMGKFGGADPLAEMLASWGITLENDRVILREQPGRNRQPEVGSMHQFQDWSRDFAVTAALSGLPAVFAQAMPIKLGDGAAQKVQLHALVNITGERLWAEDNLQNQSPKYNKDNAAPSFTLAAAAEKDHGRLMVVSDGIWATDQVVSYGLLGPGTAEMFGAAFPGNAELFVNSVLWLGRMDQLIAAGARTQDIRRVQDLSARQLIALRWGLLVGLPVLVLLAGAGVWLVRRRD